MLSFYHFEPVLDPLSNQNNLFTSIQNIPGLHGMVDIALEGMNAQMAVPPGEALEKLLRACSSILPFDPFKDNPPNLGHTVPINTPTFDRLVICVQDLVLRDGTPTKDGNNNTLDWTDAGREMSPVVWHAGLSVEKMKEDMEHPIVIDCHKIYESNQGTFRNAIPLATNTFQETQPALKEIIAQGLPRNLPIHIFCTCGIQ